MTEETKGTSFKYNTLRKTMELKAKEMLVNRDVCITGGNFEVANIYTHRLLFLSELCTTIYPEPLHYADKIDELKIIPLNRPRVTT